MGWGLLALTLAMVLGVGSASGRTATITTITVEIIGGGKVKSDPKGLDCGDDNNTGACYVAFSGTGSSVDLKAVPGRRVDVRGLECRRTTPTAARRNATALVPLDGGDHVVTANFQGPSTGTSTLDGHAHRPGLRSGRRDQLRSGRRRH